MKLVAVEVEGVTQVHASGVASGYATLCGLDGEDESIEQYLRDLPKKPKINCQHCINIIEAAWTYTKKDIKS